MKEQGAFDGCTGMRWGTDAVTGVKWQRRTFDLSVGQKTTKLTLRSGTTPPVRVGIGSDDMRTIKPGTSLRVPARHPAGNATHCDS